MDDPEFSAPESAAETADTATALTCPPEAAGTRLDQWLAAQLPELSRSRLKALIEDGHVSINGAVAATPSRKLKAADEIALTVPAPQPARPQAENIPLDIVFEDDDVIVVNKPAGLVTHPGAGNGSGTLVNALLYHCGNSLSGIGGVLRPGIVHRLDKDTSGLIVAAKTDRAHKSLRAQFDDHTIDRAYHAFVWNCPRPLIGTVDHPISRHRHNRLKMAIAKPGNPTAKRAVTHYRVLKKFGGDPPATKVSLVECVLETGRTHQIRVHMAHIGNPVLGDPLYATGRNIIAMPQNLEHNENISIAELCARGQALHAFRLGFVHPVTGEHLVFERDFPNELKRLQRTLELF